MERFNIIIGIKIISKLVPVKRDPGESEHAGSDGDIGNEVAKLTIAHAEYPVTVDKH